MKPKEMNKINRRIQEYIDNYQPAKLPNILPDNILSVMYRQKNRAKRLARKLRGK